MNSERVKIKNTDYHEESDTISWTVTLNNGNDADLVWMRSEFGECFGIKGVMPPNLVEEFNKKMLNKEINLVVEKKPEV